MFSGIVQKTSPVIAFSEKNGVRSVRVKKPADWELTLGQSIAVDGICSTVMNHAEDFFDVEYMPETLKKTTARSFGPNVLVHLERSLTLTDFVDGHIVQGHVDARAPVVLVEDEGGSRVVTISIPKKLLQFVAPRGSIAINGVSLTVARQKGARITVGLIPFTMTSTNLGLLKKGDAVNIEVDIFARYVVAARSGGTVGLHAAKRDHKRKKAS